MTSTPDLPPAKDDPDEDEAQLTAFPWAEPPFKVDYCGRISCVPPSQLLRALRG